MLADVVVQIATILRVSSNELLGLKEIPDKVASSPKNRRVLLDAELAALYSVTTKRLYERVRRNAERFPEDFMFRLTASKAAALRSQFATSNTPLPAGVVAGTCRMP